MPPISATQKLLRASSSAAPHYDRLAQLPQVVNTRLVERLNPLTLIPQTILDLGTGTGDLLVHMQQRYPAATCYGLDLSSAMLKQAAHKTSALLLADACSLPFPDHSVDLICSTFLLEWVPDLLNTLAEIKRVLSPNGLFIFATLGPGTLQELRQSGYQFDEQPHVNLFYDMHDIGDMLLRLKFIDPVIERDDFTLLYPNLLSLIKELKFLGSFKKAEQVFAGLTGKTYFDKLATAYPREANPPHFPATFEVIYGQAFGSSHSLADDEAGITRIPISKIKR